MKPCRLIVPAKPFPLPTPSTDTVFQEVLFHMVVKMFESQAQLVADTLKEWSRAKKWLGKWVTKMLQLKTYA